ncbi:hypothetical protein LIER_02032 [Lithospermum erythrorhizon]|uniref:Uncharacterized protein n=1 Tax=Lithospermum erythrorhizon TaxID=34254 RepID=A0AAV3NQG7_LITER
MGGNPPNANAVSAKPLSVCPPFSSTTESSHARTTPSASQTAEVVQAVTNAGKSSDIPTIIHDSLLVEFSNEDFHPFICRNASSLRRGADMPSSIPPVQEVLKESSSLHLSTLDSLHEEGADSAPKVKTGYSANFLELPYTKLGGFHIKEERTLWRKQDAFRTSRPLL